MTSLRSSFRTKHDLPIIQANEKREPTARFPPHQKSSYSPKSLSDLLQAWTVLSFHPQSSHHAVTFPQVNSSTSVLAPQPTPKSANTYCTDHGLSLPLHEFLCCNLEKKSLPILDNLSPPPRSFAGVCLVSCHFLPCRQPPISSARNCPAAPCASKPFCWSVAGPCCVAHPHTLRPAAGRTQVGSSAH